MIKIGDFARLGQVSVVTLRHYDEIGLLKPVSVDRFSGYRYYSVGQLPRLNRILALKDLGFSLEQIELVLSGLTLNQLHALLKLRQAEAERQVAQEQARLARIAARLRQIESEEHMSDYDVVLKTVPPMLVAAQRVTIPTNDQVPAYLGPAFGAAYQHVRQYGAKDTGPCLAIWHQAAEVHANEVADAAVPIDRAIPSAERVSVYELPQQQVAAAVHHGAFTSFVQVHTAILTWIEANGYQIAGPYREIYINHDPANMDEAATEIQYPVVRG
jgi:DNA-binding transcriptional MerR regulator